MTVAILNVVVFLEEVKLPVTSAFGSMCGGLVCYSLTHLNCPLKYHQMLVWGFMGWQGDNFTIRTLKHFQMKVGFGKILFYFSENGPIFLTTRQKPPTERRRKKKPISVVSEWRNTTKTLTLPWQTSWVYHLSSSGSSAWNCLLHVVMTLITPHFDGFTVNLTLGDGPLDICDNSLDYSDWLEG